LAGRAPHDAEHPKDAAGEPPGAGDARRFPGSEILSQESPKRVLSRLVDGDPLEIQARCKEHVYDQAWLLSVSRVHLRSVARIAHAAMRYRGEPALDAWLKERVEQSTLELLEEDLEEERVGIPPAEPWDPRYAFVSEALGIEPTLARRACVEFNLLPHEVRCAYFAVVVEGKTIHRHVAEGHGPPDQARSHLKLALRTLGKAIGRDWRSHEGDGADDE
jgi:hypothetical protein